MTYLYGTVWNVARQALTPRSSWTKAGLRALADGGPDAVRIEPLAQTLGVTKGSFYWHFDGRPALLQEMLDRWEQTMVDEVIVRVERQGGDPRAKLRRLFSLARAFTMEGLLEIELSIRDWARRDQAVAERLRRVDNRRMDYLRTLFGAFCPDEDEVEVRCLLVMSLFIGTHFVAAEHGRRKRGEVLGMALARLLA